MPHVIGWLALALVAFLQPPGQVAADTKFDLVADPARFLARALHIWTDEFPLGQIQNQAYGYLFPQGLFFLTTSPLPSWISQRLWWLIVMGVAYSGTLVLARRLGLSRAGAVLAAVLYALSPRVLTTLTAISSEAWPVALVPWTLVPLVGSRRPNVAAAVVPVALMGGVNGAATIAACTPAFVFLLARREFRAAGLFFAGAVAVSLWWLGPLFVLGRYSPPFTDFIESATVTTSWLTPVEILRGTTSWAPFVDTERVAGHLLVAEPVFVLATCVVAALGLAGLSRAPREFVVMFAVGFGLLGAAHWGIFLLDGPLAPFRNLHKFDPLVRVPLVLGVGFLVSRVPVPRVHVPRVRAAQFVGVTLVAAVAVAPAWSLRLLPQGTWSEVSPDWVAAGAWLDEHAAGTRTLVVPPASFARQEWGWTRDEPIQGLTSVPFAFRDAIPLVDPEAIRGLDGQVLLADPEALRSIGVGAVVVRHDLESHPGAPGADALGEPAATFGDVDIHLLDPVRDMMITDGSPVTVDAGGEALPLLWRHLGYFPAQLTGTGDNGAGATIITDTPALAARNYGTLDGQGAHQAFPGEDDTVTNRVADYPSAGTRVGVTMESSPGGYTASASSSASDAGAFGGPDASKSLTAAFDGLAETAWWPAPGDREPALFVDTNEPYSVTATATTQVELSDGTDTRRVTLIGGEPREIAPKWRWIHLTEPVGISEVDAGITRIVDVPGTGDAYLFQRHFPATGVIHRRFTTAADATWELSAPAVIDGVGHPAGPVFLAASTHELVSDAPEVLLTQPLDLPPWVPFAGTVEPADTDRIVLTTRGFNPGLRAIVGGEELEPMHLEPIRIDAASQAFLIPAGACGEFRMWHAGERPYQAALVFGGVFSLLALAWCLWVPWRRPGASDTAAALNTAPAIRRSWVPATAAVLVNPLAGIPAALLAWLTTRFTLIRSSWLTGGAMTVAGLWLARGPWPAENYAGGTWLLAFAGCLAVASLSFPASPSTEARPSTGARPGTEPRRSRRTRRAPGTSTSS